MKFIENSVLYNRQTWTIILISSHKMNDIEAWWKANAFFFFRIFFFFNS